MLCPAALRECCFQKLPLCSRINSCCSSMLAKSKRSQESKQARVLEPRDHAGVHVPFHIPSLSTLLQSQECSPVNICILPLESVLLLCRGLCCLLLTCCLVSMNCPCHPFQPAYFYLKKKKKGNFFFFRADLGFQKIGRYKVPHIFWDQDLSHHSSEFVAIGKPILTHLYAPPQSIYSVAFDKYIMWRFEGEWPPYIVSYV